MSDFEMLRNLGEKVVELEKKYGNCFSVGAGERHRLRIEKLEKKLVERTSYSDHRRDFNILKERIEKLEKKLEHIEEYYIEEGIGERVEKLEASSVSHTDRLNTHRDAINNRNYKSIIKNEKVIDELKDKISGIGDLMIDEKAFVIKEIDELKEQLENEYRILSGTINNTTKNREVLRELYLRVELIGGYVLDQGKFDYVFNDKYWENKKKLGGDLTADIIRWDADGGDNPFKRGGDSLRDGIDYEKEYNIKGGEQSGAKERKDELTSEPIRRNPEVNVEIQPDSKPPKCPECDIELDIDINTLNSGDWYCGGCGFSREVKDEKPPEARQTECEHLNKSYKRDASGNFICKDCGFESDQLEKYIVQARKTAGMILVLREDLEWYSDHVAFMYKSGEKYKELIEKYLGEK